MNPWLVLGIAAGISSVPLLTAFYLVWKELGRRRVVEEIEV